MNCWSGNPRDPPLTIQALTIPLGCLLELDDNTLLLKTSTYLSYKIWRNQARTELEAFFLLAFVGLESPTQATAEKTSTVLVYINFNTTPPGKPCPLVQQ